MSQFFLNMHVCMQSMHQLTQSKSGSTGNARLLPVKKDTCFFHINGRHIVKKHTTNHKTRYSFKGWLTQFHSSHCHCKCSQKNIKWNV